MKREGLFLVAFLLMAVGAMSINAKNAINYMTVDEPGQGIEETNAAVKATKSFENGQLVIEKNGKLYNALGIRMQ